MFGIIIRGKTNKTRYWTNDRMEKAFGNREDHAYRHINRAMGVKVEGKEHFRQLLEQGHYVPYEDGCIEADKVQAAKTKKYDGLSKKAERVIANLKATADKDGNLSSREGTARACREVGMKLGYYGQLPSAYDKGGFNA